MDKPNRNWPQIGCVMLLTAAVAFPAGLWMAGSTNPRADAPKALAPLRSGSAVRNPYSATIRNDPHVLDAQRAVVEAMERACDRERTQCAEAAAARRYLDDRPADAE